MNRMATLSTLSNRQKKIFEGILNNFRARHDYECHSKNMDASEYHIYSTLKNLMDNNQDKFECTYVVNVSISAADNYRFSVDFYNVKFIVGYTIPTLTIHFDNESK